MTVFEKYKPNTFFTPSYFLSGKYNVLENDDGDGDSFALSAGVLFRHRFPRNRVLWNLGASLEFMLCWGNWYGDLMFDYEYEYGGWDGNREVIYTETRTERAEVSYHGYSFLLGMGIQTGFSFRYNPYMSLDLNGLLKFPFGTMDMKREIYGNGENAAKAAADAKGFPENKPYWPFTAGFEVGLTFWFPYRSRR
jgi:hypothetical protein